MTFTIHDFQDLLRLLRERPDLLEQLRAHILTREMLLQDGRRTSTLLTFGIEM